MKKGIILLLLLPAFWACEPALIEPGKKFNQSNTLDLSNPKEGQKTYYQMYQSNCENLEKDFEYPGDTLVVEVMKKNGEWIMAEYLTDYSTTEGPRDTTYNLFVPMDAYVLLPNRWTSRLFYFYGNDTLNLKPNNRSNLIQNSCRLEISGETFVGNEIGKLDQFELPNLKLKNKTAVSCVPMIFAMEGYLIYDQNDLYASHTIFANTDEDQIVGWIRL